MTITAQGRIYAADTRTGAVHVFDGKPLFRFTPTSLTQNVHVALVHRQNALELWIFNGKTTVNRYALPESRMHAARCWQQLRLHNLGQYSG